jgi:hypothetical protein
LTAQKWIESRRPGGGFPSVSYIFLWSRLERGDRAGQFITGFVSRSAANNLHNRGANQSDATFGFAAGVPLPAKGDWVLLLLRAGR